MEMTMVEMMVDVMEEEVRISVDERIVVEEMEMMEEMVRGRGKR